MAGLSATQMVLPRVPQVMQGVVEIRGSRGEILGCFASYIGINHSLHAEPVAAMIVIELVHSKGWKHIWLECESMLVIVAFKSSKIVPWSLRNRSNHCLSLCKSMQFIFTHIFREGNCCADKLASYRANNQNFFLVGFSS